jgi:hypothetical protein
MNGLSSKLNGETIEVLHRFEVYALVTLDADYRAQVEHVGVHVPMVDRPLEKGMVILNRYAAEAHEAIPDRHTLLLNFLLGMKEQRPQGARRQPRRTR